MAGGILVQDSSHPSIHGMLTPNGRITVNSLHHQRQYPWGNKWPRYKLLGWCEELSPFNRDGDNKEMPTRPEIEMAAYPDIQALTIQSHPEMRYPAIKTWEQDYIAYCRKILTEHMNG